MFNLRVSFIKQFTTVWVLFLFVQIYANNICDSDNKLGYHLKVGNVFVISAELKQTQTTEQCGEFVSGRLEFNGKFKYEVLDVDKDGNMRMELEFLSVAYYFYHPYGDISTDFSPWYGKKIQFLLSPQGKTYGFEGVDLLPVISNEQKTFTVKEIVDGIAQMFLPLPDTYKNVGDEWISNTDIEEDHLVQKNEYSYKVLEKLTFRGQECLKISVNKNIEESSQRFQNNNSCVTEIEIGLEGTSEGIIYYSLESGLIISIQEKTGKEGILVAAETEMPTEIESTYLATIKFD